MSSSGINSGGIGARELHVWTQQRSRFNLALSIFIVSAAIISDASAKSGNEAPSNPQAQPVYASVYYEPSVIRDPNEILDEEAASIAFDLRGDNNNIDTYGELLNGLLQQQKDEATTQEFGDYSSLEDEGSNFFELPASINQISGLAVNANDNLVLFHRSGRVWDENTFTNDERLNASLRAINNATIAVMDTKNGKILAEHGRDLFYMPHGLTIDADGNHWLTDVGTHQVTKMDKSFKPMLVLGEKLVPGNDTKHFCKPTDVAVAKSGEFFVADGYCNSRIMKFTMEGKFVTSFGSFNSEIPPKAGEFFVPHSLTLIEDLNLLCVADRENERIQCFAAGLSGGAHHHPRTFVPTGTFFTKAENIGRVYALREKKHYLVGVTGEDEGSQLEPQVFVMDMNSGRASTFAKGLVNAHALAISDSGDVYVSQLNPNQIVKFNIIEASTAVH